MFMFFYIVGVDFLRITTSAESNTTEYATVNVITNNISGGILQGTQTGVDIKNKTENKTTLIKKDGIIYMSLDDICKFTRTIKKEVNNEFILKQGLQTINIIFENNDNSKIKSIYGEFNIKSTIENDKMYCEPEPLMSMLFANCTYYNNNILIDLPQYTVYEALDFEYSKYQSDVLSYGINENDNMNTGLIKWGLVVQRAYISHLFDIVVDGNYGFFASDNTISQYCNEAFNEVLGYDIYSNESVKEEETKIYENVKELISFLEKTKNEDISDTPFTDFYISSYIDSYAEISLKDNNSLSMFNDTIRDLSENGRANEKLNSYLNKSGKEALTNILFNSILEHVKRSSYDKKVLEMFKTLYSENMIKKHNINLTDNGNTYFQCARDYYNSCNSFDDIVKEVALDETINKFSEIIIKGLFSVTTVGKSQEVFETYETVLTVEKLRESSSTFKPIEKINNSAEYFWLAKMQYSTLIVLDEMRKEVNENPNSENLRELVSSIDFYNRISAVMIKTLADSYQLPTTTQREKDLIANSQKYINELCENVYKLEYCEYNLSTKEELNNKKCDTFKEIFKEATPSEPTPTAINWYVEPTIEAEDIIVSDIEKINYYGFNANPFDEYSIINQNGKFNFIKYNGAYISDMQYDEWYFSKPDAITCSSKNNDCITILGESGNEISYEPHDAGWGRQGFYIDNKTKEIYATEYDSASKYNESNNVVVQSSNITITSSEQNYSTFELNNAGKYGIANSNGLVVDCIYDDACMNIGNDIIALQKDGKWGYFNKDGTQIIDFVCEPFESKILDVMWWHNHDDENIQHPFLSSSEYIPVKINGQCGYYDTEGNEVIPCGTFEEVRPVHNGLAWVKKDGKWGVIQLDNLEIEDTTTPTPTTPDNIIAEGICGDNLTWTLYTTGQLTIKGTGGMYDYADIGSPFYKHKQNIKSVTISDDVTYIGENSFAYCEKLEDINLPDGLTIISYGCLRGCKSLKNIAIPESVTKLGLSAFSNCEQLTSIKLPDNLIEIDFYAFSGCENLIDIVIPESVEVLGNGAFSECSKLKSIIIPNSVKKISSDTFACCTSLTSVTIAKDVEVNGKNIFYKTPNVVIYGYSATSAEKYAKTNKIPFVKLDNPETEASTENSLSENDLKDAIISKGNICAWEYADYDGNGTKEAFAIIGTNSSSDFYISDSIQGVYFISSEGIVEELGNASSGLMCSIERCTEYAGKKFFSYNATAGGSGIQTYLFSVKGGNYYELEISGKIADFYSKNDICYATKSEFLQDGGHIWPEYELIYDENTQEFSLLCKISDSENAYYSFIKNELVPNYGLSNLKNLDIANEPGYPAPNYDEWYGVISAEILDISGKSTLLTITLKEIDGCPNLVLDLYGYDGEVYLIDSYVEMMPDWTVGFNVCWNKNYLTISYMYHFNYVSSTRGSGDIILDIKDNMFRQDFSLYYCRYPGGAMSIFNSITEKTYFQTDGSSYDRLSEAVEMVKSDLATLGISNYEISAEDYDFFFDMKHTKEICAFSIYEEKEQAKDYTNLRDHLTP